jgi:hypothetical protein
MIGCLYPTHAQTALRALGAAQPDLVARVRGLKASASPLSPEELDKLRHLAATDCQTWALDELACAREFGLTILISMCARIRSDDFGVLLRNGSAQYSSFGEKRLSRGCSGLFLWESFPKNVTILLLL